MREDRFRKAARERRTLFNAWLTLNNPFLIELIGEAGWDCITIDQQHGLWDTAATAVAIASIRAAGSAPVVRVPLGAFATASRALSWRFASLWVGSP